MALYFIVHITHTHTHVYSIVYPQIYGQIYGLHHPSHTRIYVCTYMNVCVCVLLYTIHRQNSAFNPLCTRVQTHTHNHKQRTHMSSSVVHAKRAHISIYYYSYSTAPRRRQQPMPTTTMKRPSGGAVAEFRQHRPSTSKRPANSKPQTTPTPLPPTSFNHRAQSLTRYHHRCVCVLLCVSSAQRWARGRDAERLRTHMHDDDDDTHACTTIS